LSAPFIYSIASHFTSRPVASFIAILSVLAPTNTYTAYYMPESLYFLSFWIFSWYILKLDYRSAYTSWICASLIFAITSLIKPRSLFALPGLTLYFAYLIRQRPAKVWAARWFFISATFVSVAIGTKLALGFAFAGKAGLTLFGSARSFIPIGSTYSSIPSDVARGAWGLERYMELVTLAIVNLAGHLLALSVLFCTVLAAILFSLGKALSRNEAGNASLKVSLYAFSFIAPLILLTALYTVSVLGEGPYETPFRLHMRYYNVAFPLLLMVAASQLSTTKERFTFARILVAVPVAAAAIYAAVTALAPYTPNFVDSPEIRGLAYRSDTFYMLTAIGLISLLCWIRECRLGSQIFLFVVAPPAFILTSYFSSVELRNRLVPDVFDRAGIFAHQYLEGSTSHLAVMGSSLAGLFRSLFYVDDPQASLVEIPTGSPADLSRIAGDKEWLLVIGDHASPAGVQFKLPLNGFSLFRVAKSYEIDFTRRSWPGLLSRVQGLSFAESWGTWSDGSKVTLEFQTPLPRSIMLHLKALAFGPNVGQKFTIEIGAEAAEFVLADSPQEIAIPFRTSEASASIVISIPSPISPKELGFGNDSRKLGLGFYRLKVEDITRY
jgi:phosphoglycerol transferase